jgi:hypothetical protein
MKYLTTQEEINILYEITKEIREPKKQEEYVVTFPYNLICLKEKLNDVRESANPSS